MDGRRKVPERRSEQISELINSTINQLERVNWPNARQSLDYSQDNDWLPFHSPALNASECGIGKR